MQDSYVRYTLHLKHVDEGERQIKMPIAESVLGNGDRLFLEEIRASMSERPGWNAWITKSDAPWPEVRLDGRKTPGQEWTCDLDFRETEGRSMGTLSPPHPGS